MLIQTYLFRQIEMLTINVIFYSSFPSPEIYEFVGILFIFSFSDDLAHFLVLIA